MSAASRPKGERLQKILARAGIASRRAAEELVREGRVTVNGKVVAELGARADPAVDRIACDGQPVRPPRRAWFAVNKPAGMLTTMRDPQGRRTIRELLPPKERGVVPVGRLDYQTSGLLLLTNDGDLAAKLLHPRSAVPRTYRVKVHGIPTENTLGRMRQGVRLDDGRTGPAEVRIESERENKAWLRLTLREGRRREVRRICEATGHPVDRLIRVSFGPVRLGKLRSGEMRSLTAAEIAGLEAAVGSPPGPARPARAGSAKRPPRAWSAKRPQAAASTKKSPRAGSAKKPPRVRRPR